MMKRFDKNKDGKLDVGERAAIAKAFGNDGSGKRTAGSAAR
jgi:hypothetical protein